MVVAGSDREVIKHEISPLAALAAPAPLRGHSGHLPGPDLTLAPAWLLANKSHISQQWRGSQRR